MLNLPLTTTVCFCSFLLLEPNPQTYCPASLLFASPITKVEPLIEPSRLISTANLLSFFNKVLPIAMKSILSGLDKSTFRHISTKFSEKKKNENLREKLPSNTQYHDYFSQLRKMLPRHHVRVNHLPNFFFTTLWWRKKFFFCFRNRNNFRLRANFRKGSADVIKETFSRLLFLRNENLLFPVLPTLINDT